jgi:hypothetical protein
MKALTRLVGAGGAYVALVLGSSCFDSGSRWFAPEPVDPPDPLCERGKQRCTLTALEECKDGDAGVDWQVIDDCEAHDEVCAPGLLACTLCYPDETYCDDQDVLLCSSDGESSAYQETCDPSVGQACRSGGCPTLCVLAAEEKSNVGCEYWAVDLDNAMIDAARNAAAQQFAVVVSNPQHDVPVQVDIYRDEAAVGAPNDEVRIATAVIAPLNLRVFKLGPREVDGSPEGEFNTGTHTALTRAAFKVVTDFPVVAYQFNPLENVNVFSNDASLLKPREALTYDTPERTMAYVVAGWPQTIAITDDPNTNFSSNNPLNLRAFLTIVGTMEGTRVLVRSTTQTVAGEGVPATGPGQDLEMNLGPYDVLNLETPDLNAFGADFTGTIIEADNPIAVFVGSEASDAPNFETLTSRRCCADHLEEQLDPVRTAGKHFALATPPSRTRAVKAAGGELGVTQEPEFFRFVSTVPETTVIETTLPPPDDSISLVGYGDFYEVTTYRDFLADSTEPIHVVQIDASQDAANVPRALPGGDPSLLVVPPREQFRSTYVFLTPDKYAFDFVTVVAPPEAFIELDNSPLDAQTCDVAPTDGLTEEERGDAPIELLSYRCQLSFPAIHPDTGEILPGNQNDGVHRIVSDYPIGVTVFGFDRYVSYSYAGGTELREIAIPK